MEGWAVALAAAAALLILSVGGLFAARQVRRRRVRVD